MDNVAAVTAFMTVVAAVTAYVTAVTAYMTAFTSFQNVDNVDDARFLFKQMDHDGDGVLSQEELRKSGSR